MLPYFSFVPHIAAVSVIGMGAAVGFAFEAPAAHAAQAPEREISVLADTVSKSALTEAIAAFERANPGVVVRPRFAGSRVIREQVRLGAQPDAVLMPSTEAGAMNGELAAATPAFRDHTTIVVSSAAVQRIRGAADLAAAGVRLGVGRAGTVLADLDDAVIAQVAASQPADYRDRVAANVAEEEHDTQRGALVDAVAAGSIDAAILFASDAVPGKSTGVALPAGVGRTQTEVAAVVRGSANAALARRFVAMLGSRRAAAIFRAHGHDPID